MKKHEDMEKFIAEKWHISKQTAPVIRGMWRQGATLEQISVHLNIPYEYIRKEVETYFSDGWPNLGRQNSPIWTPTPMPALPK